MGVDGQGRERRKKDELERGHGPAKGQLVVHCGFGGRLGLGGMPIQHREMDSQSGALNLILDQRNNHPPKNHNQNPSGHDPCRAIPGKECPMAMSNTQASRRA
jgi:hypothetical protein